MENTVDAKYPTVKSKELENMKKKILSILLIVILVIGLTGCGKKNNDAENTGTEGSGTSTTAVKAKIINNDGKEEMKTQAELNDILSQNNEYFTKNYDGAKVTIVDTVKEIKKDALVSWPKTPGGEYFIGHTYEITLTSGWYVYIDQNNNDLSDILSGTKVEVSSYVHDNTFWPIIRGTFENDENGNSIEITDSTIKVLD